MQVAENNNLAVTDEYKHIKVIEAAKMMGKCQQFVRVGLQRGLLPFGTAIKAQERWNYYISPKLFYEYVGK